MNWRRKVCIFVLLFSVLFHLSLAVETNQGLEKGIKLFEEKKYPEAREFFEGFVKENPKNDTALFYIGKIWLIQDDHDKSIDWLKKSVELNDTSCEYHIWLGQAYGVKAQNSSMLKQPFLAKKVKKEFKKAVELDSANLDARFALAQYYLVAPGIMGGNKDEAKKQAEEIKKQDPLLGHQAFGLIYEHEEEYEKAEKEYLAAVEKDTSKVNSYYELGYFYGRIKKYDNAAQTFEKIVEIHPEEMGAYYQIGKMGALSGQNLNRAVECFKKYLTKEPGENSPSLAWAHYRLGMVYEKKGEKELAKTEYQAALKLEPDHKEAKKALKDLE
ncbi:MAG: tetratricopeptide repeat protein [Candidatus Zixiibacteriota bacterium]